MKEKIKKIIPKLSFILFLILVVVTWKFLVSSDYKPILSEETSYPSIHVDGTLYYFTGEKVDEEFYDESLKAVSDILDVNEVPTKEGEMNLTYPEASYTKFNDNVVVRLGEDWILFKNKKEAGKPITFTDYVKNLQVKLEEEKNMTEILSAEKEEYYQFAQLAMNFLSKEAMTEIIRNQWGYCMRINGELIPKDGIVVLEEGPVTVKARETRLSYPIMALDDYNKGGLPGNSFIEHVDFMENVPEDEIIEDGTSVQLFTYVFGKTEPIDKMEFHISEDMMVRLGLDTTVIKIKVGK